MGYVASAVLAISLVSAASAGADELIRKGGDWETTMTGMPNMPGMSGKPQTMTMCLAPSTFEQAMAKLASADPNCSKKDMTRDGDTIHIDFVCTRMSMKGTATLSGDSAYSGDFTITTNTPNGQQTFQTHTDSKWVGPCKPGEQPMGTGAPVRR